MAGKLASEIIHFKWSIKLALMKFDTDIALTTNAVSQNAKYFPSELINLLTFVIDLLLVKPSKCSKV